MTRAYTREWTHAVVVTGGIMSKFLRIMLVSALTVTGLSLPAAMASAVPVPSETVIEQGPLDGPEGVEEPEIVVGSSSAPAVEAPVESEVTSRAPVEEGIGDASTYVQGDAGAALGDLGALINDQTAAAEDAGLVAEAFSARADIVQRTNALRAEHGIAPLRADWRLDVAAQAWSQVQAVDRIMKHNPLLQQQVPQGWTQLGENVAYGQRTTAAVMNAWRHSAGHYANIMNPGFTNIGVGVAYALNGAPYYTQVFTGHSGVVPKPPSGNTTIPFIDMAIGSPFLKEITWMYASGLSTGVTVNGGKAYQPKASVSREAMAAFLYRVSTPKGAKAPAGFVVPKSSPFADVPTSHKFFKEIAWMRWSGISNGVAQPAGKPKYAPKAAVSREAMAAFMYRLENGRGGLSPAKVQFGDVNRNHKFFTEIVWMYDRGLSTGVKQGQALPHYQPQVSVSREAMAAFLYRLKH